MVENVGVVEDQKATSCMPEAVMVNGKIVFTPEELLKIRAQAQIDAQKYLDTARLTVGDFVPIAAIVVGLLEFTWVHESE